jgi:hypothetical protein
VPPNLLPTDALSQVVFVHDYLQLIFQDSAFSIYNPLTLQMHGASLRLGQPGFCDLLVGLIGQPLSSVSTSGIESVVLVFAGGAVLSVSRQGSGPEAWQFNCFGQPTVVEQNA